MKKISAVIAAASVGLIAQAQLVDDFNSAGLSEYTQSVVLAQSAGSAIAFSDSTGTLSVSRASGTDAQQVLLLRGDYTLGVGQSLRVDALSPVVGSYTDFGIVVSALVDPPDAVWTSGTADVRQNYINVYLKHSTGAIGYVGFNGTANVGASSGVFPPSFGAVTGLFINRLALDSFDVGYTTASGDTVLKSFTGMNTAIGTAIGFYADVRAVTSYSDLDNLSIAAVPEPSTLALCGMSFLGLVAVMRRKK